jgi:hypothetical protein
MYSGGGRVRPRDTAFRSTPHSPDGIEGNHLRHYWQTTHDGLRWLTVIGPDFDTVDAAWHRLWAENDPPHP